MLALLSKQSQRNSRNILVRQLFSFLSMNCQHFISAHIFFDDAVDLTGGNIPVPNVFVTEFMDCIDDALRYVG